MNINEESSVEDLKNNEEEETSKNEESQEKDYKELYENQRIRAEKAEKKLKETKTEDKTSKKEEATSENNYSLKDIRALNAIPDEDVDDFLELSKKFEISPAEAKGNKDLQAILKSRAEERKTAEATNIDKGKKGSGKISGANALEKARATGKLPDSDAELDAMLEARYSPKS